MGVWKIKMEKEGIEAILRTYLLMVIGFLVIIGIGYVLNLIMNVIR